MYKAIATICVALLTGHAWAVNKCTGPDGKIVFQDTPCIGKGEKIEVRPASGNAPAPQANIDGTKPISEAERLEALTAASQKDRRRWDLRDRLVPGATDEIAQHKYRCEQTQKQLAAEQHRYVQNLYGKTHAAQAASEMAAAAALCDTKSRELKENLEALQRECATLDCTRR